MRPNLITLIQEQGLVVAPGASDALTARLVQQAGFEAVYMTGFGATATKLGAPDIGLLTQTEMAEHARSMTRAVQIPVIADADTGYGGPSNVDRTIAEYAQAGVSALHLEDQLAPKRCGQMAGIKLADAEENASRLRGAIDARNRYARSEMLIIGRTDALPVAGFDEALRRARLYQEAGVDLAFIDGVKTRAEVEAIADALDGPKVLSLVDGTDAAKLTARDVKDMGFQVLLHAVTALFTATKAVQRSLAHLRAAGVPGADSAQHSYAEFVDIVDIARHSALDDEFGRGYPSAHKRGVTA